MVRVEETLKKNRAIDGEGCQETVLKMILDCIGSRRCWLCVVADFVHDAADRCGEMAGHCGLRSRSNVSTADGPKRVIIPGNENIRLRLGQARGNSKRQQRPSYAYIVY